MSPDDRFPGTLPVFLSLGSNLGDSAAVLREAAACLRSEFRPGAPFLSSLWATPPVDCPPGSPDFINAVACIRVPDAMEPEGLLDRLQAMESEFGRRPKIVLNEPRPLDIDILTFGAMRLGHPRLILPHPRAHLRHFVLAPWAELAPQLLIPGLGLTVGAALEKLGPHPGIRRLGGAPSVEP